MADRGNGPNSPRPAPASPSIPAALARSGIRTAGRVARATRIDDAVDVVAEEAIVRAVESDAVERALHRIVAGPVIETAVEEALTSPNVERALREALDSEMVDRVWEQLLESEEVQQLFEHIGEAPELRAAIAAQGVGLMHDVGIESRRLAQTADDRVESVVRRVVRRSSRSEPSPRAGLASRAIAFVLDMTFVNLGFLVVSGLITFLVSTLFGVGQASTEVLVAGTGLWLVGAALYLVGFWALAGQTPGMRFVGIQLDSGSGRRIGIRRAVRRLIGLVLATIPLGAGLIAIAINADRRGWHDRFAHTDVLYGAGPDELPRVAARDISGPGHVPSSDA